MGVSVPSLHRESTDSLIVIIVQSVSLSPPLSLFLFLFLAAELENISSQFNIGFGSFGDKVAYPYASTIRTQDAYLTNDLTHGYVGSMYGSIHKEI